MYRHYYKIVQRANVDNVPERVNSIFSLFIAIVLAMVFTGYQLHEYIVASYHIADGVYTCDFFMATGFHGFHVILGTVFLLVSFFRLLFSHFTRESHLGLEFAI
jgi:cytochrome c oxidase subunit 3